MMNLDSESNPLRKIRASLIPSITADIGPALKKAREKRGHSLELVSQHTRISKRYLEAMEGNRFEELPALAYLRSFLKTYCEYLEIDFEPLWNAAVSHTHPATSGSESSHAPSVVASAPGTPGEENPTRAEETRHGASAAPPAHAAPRPGQGSPAGSERLILHAALFAAAAFACLLLVWAQTRREKAAPVPAVATPPAALEPIHPPPELNLEIHFQKEVWLKLTADGQLRFEGRVPADTQQIWKAKKTMILNTSNAGGLALNLNGSPYALPAPDGAGNYRVEAVLAPPAPSHAPAPESSLPPVKDDEPTH